MKTNKFKLILFDDDVRVCKKRGSWDDVEEEFKLVRKKYHG